MRLRVRRLNSLLMASNPSPSAINGTAKLSSTGNDSLASRVPVKMRRNRNGSEVVIDLMSPIVL